MPTVNLKLKKKSYFKELLGVYSLMAPFKELKKKEKELYAEYLLEDYTLRIEKGIEDKELRDRILFAYETTTNICTRLKINKAYFYNLVMALKKNNIIVNDSLKIVLSPEKHGKVIFDLKLVEDDSKGN